MDKQNFKFSQLEYVRPGKEECVKKLKEFKERFDGAQSYDEFRQVLDEFNDFEDGLQDMVTLAMIRNTLDTTDKFYEAEIEYIDEVFPELSEYEVDISRSIYESSFRDSLEKEFGRQLTVGIKRQLDSFRPEMIPFMQEDNKLSTQYQKLMATASIPFDGQELNLYGIQKYFEHPDREVRKAAFKAYSDFYRSNEDEMEQIFGRMVEVRNSMGRALGYENFIPLAYKNQGREDYGPKEAAAFREQVREELVPLCEELYRAQAKRIGVEKIMAFDEIFVFPDGNPEPAGDDEYMVEQARRMYHDISPETGEFIDFMIEHELMDLKNRPNKASTGYMTSLIKYKAPFVFSCFNHTTFDMQVLSHELGHAFAGYQAMRHQPISAYYSEPTDIAEIHSMSMEQFAYPYAEQFFGKDADKYRFKHLQEAITFVPFGAAVDEFQHIMYEKPELTPKERTYEWHKLEQKYMPWRSYEDDEFMERGGYWYHKLHIFQYPFYYLNYTLTTIGAMEMKKRYAEDKQRAWQDYMTLCNVGGSLGYLETLRAARLSVPFEEGSVRNAVSYAKDILLKAID